MEGRGSEDRTGHSLPIHAHLSLGKESPKGYIEEDQPWNKIVERHDEMEDTKGLRGGVKMNGGEGGGGGGECVDATRDDDDDREGGTLVDLYEGSNGNDNGAVNGKGKAKDDTYLLLNICLSMSVFTPVCHSSRTHYPPLIRRRDCFGYTSIVLDVRLNDGSNWGPR